jgi:type VI secretion system protein VasD
MGLARDLMSILVAGSAGLACAHAPVPCEKPEPIDVSLQGGPTLNPGDDGQALPTIVRVYLLKSDQAIVGAAAEDLQRSDKETLGSDLLEGKEVTLTPSSRQLVRFERSPLTANPAVVIAVAALFRRPESSAWRAIRHLPAEDPQYCHRVKTAAVGEHVLDFSVDGNRVVEVGR